MMTAALLKQSLFTLVAATSLAGSACAQAQDPTSAARADEAPLLALSTTAMGRMMAGMDVKPSGNVDADFTAMMIPHHQGAIDMALAELRFGRNEQLRGIAQEIIVDQQQEIAAMRLALGQPLPPPAPAPESMQTCGVCSGSDSFLAHEMRVGRWRNWCGG